MACIKGRKKVIVKKYIQVLGVISCLAVVWLHANGVFWQFSYEPYWITANMIESICYFAVPIFFMISGCNLIDYRERYSTKEYFKKRIMKTVIPFIFWSLFGCVYMIITKVIAIEDISVISVLNGIINTNFCGTYWFFMPLFSVYLCIPVLSLVKENRKKFFSYLIVACFVCNICLPFIFNFLPLSFNWNFSVSMAGGYLFYVLIGYYIDYYEIKRHYRIAIYVMGIIGLLLHLFGTYYLSYRDGAINPLFKDYMNVPCVLYSVAIFVFFKYMDTTKLMDWLFKGTKFFANTTFGVYLIHWFLLDAILRVTKINSYSLKYRVIGGFCVFIIASVLIKCAKKIPIVRRIVP